MGGLGLPDLDHGSELVPMIRDVVVVSDVSLVLVLHVDPGPRCGALSKQEGRKAPRARFRIGHWLDHGHGLPRPVMVPDRRA